MYSDKKVVAPLVGFRILGMGLIMVLIYVWGRKNANMNVNYWGFQFKAVYFPWALIAFNFLLGGFPILEIFGCLVGHMYYFLKDIYPNTGGSDLLKTPQFLYRMFPPAGYIPERRAGGRGYVLGRD